MKTPKAPAPPDPVATAQAQTGMNIDTAIAQQLVNQTDQVTPDGSLSYTPNGFSEYVDSSGRTIRIPRYTANQRLSTAQQGIYDTNTQTEQNLATLGRDQSGRLNTLMSEPVNLNNEATEARLFDLGTRRLNPEFERDEAALRTRLINSGIREGSAAYNAEMGRFDQRRNDAVNQLLLQGRGQAVQETLTERNQPLNEITALMSGSQVSMPNFVTTPQSGVAGTDYAGMVRGNYEAQQNQYNQRLASRNAMMGGLFGLAGAGVRAWGGVP
jgi:hypothetical protein